MPADRGFLPLSGARSVIGRGDDCHYRIDGAGVSRRHLEIHRDGPILVLRDLGSMNGTHVNGRRVEHCALAPGMVVRAGDWLGSVEELEPEDRGRAVRELAPGLYGGPALGALLAPLERAAVSNLPVVLVGATGTGKERVAQALHHWSGRRGRFHAVNCAALPNALADGELFGYQKGAFTGAERAHGGQFRAAHDGTLFLDEVADLAPPLQAKVLRAVELGQVTPLGDTRPVEFDARIVVATQVPLAELVASGRFRQDLAARLAGITVNLPALHERRSDVPGLFYEFLREHSGGRPPAVSTRLYERLCLYAFPNNVRELSLLARQLLVVHGGEPLLRRSHLPVALQDPTQKAEESTRPPAPRGRESRREHDLRRLLAAVKESGGNVSAAAELSGISRQRAYRLMTTAEREQVSSLRGETADRQGGRDEPGD